MKIECPKCQATYQLDGSKIKPSGQKVRCAKCEVVFTVYPENQARPKEPVQKENPPQSKEVVQNEKSLQKEPIQNNEKKKEDILPQTPPDESDFAQDFETPPGSEDFAYDASMVDKDFVNTESGIQTEPKKKSKLGLFLLLLFLLVIGGATVWYGYPLIQDFFQKTVIKDQTSQPFAKPVDAPPPVVNKEMVDKFILEDVRQYPVENEKIGQLLVIEGKVVNGFDSPRELIKLRASLYTDKGEAYEHKDFYAGNLISLFQLQILGKEELEAGLNAKVGILSNNINIQPGKKVSFMAVFFNLPEDVREFGLEIIDAKAVKQ